MLADVDDETLQRAALELLGDGSNNFFPHPGKLGEIAERIKTRNTYAQIEQRQTLRLTEREYTEYETNAWLEQERKRYAAQCAHDKAYQAGLRELDKPLAEWLCA